MTTDDAEDATHSIGQKVGGSFPYSSWGCCWCFIVELEHIGPWEPGRPSFGKLVHAARDDPWWRDCPEDSGTAVQ